MASSARNLINSLTPSFDKSSGVYQTQFGQYYRQYRPRYGTHIAHQDGDNAHAAITLSAMSMIDLFLNETINQDFVQSNIQLAIDNFVLAPEGIKR